MQMSGLKDPVDQIREEKKRFYQETAPQEKPTPAEEVPPTPENPEGNPGEQPAPENPEGTPAIPPQEAEEPPRAGEYWQKRFEVLQGKYNAEVPRFQEQVNSLVAQVRLLTEQLAAKTPAAETAPQMSAEEALDNLESEYGEAFTKAIDRRIDRRIGTVIDQRLQPFAEKVSQVETVQAKTAQQLFDEELSRTVPNWRTMDSDPGFLAWLDEIDEFTGVPRLRLLRDAYHKGDVGRTATFFNRYLNSQQPLPTAQPPSTAQPSTVTPQHLVVPNKKGGGTQVQIDNNQAQVIPWAEIEEFRMAVINGTYKGKDVEQRKAAYNKAITEGRVVG